MWFGLFQACCLNFDKMICKLFGDALTLSQELSFALQFSRMDFEQLVALHKYEIPSHIKALDARLRDGISENDLSDLAARGKIWISRVYVLFERWR